MASILVLVKPIVKHADWDGKCYLKNIHGTGDIVSHMPS